LKGIIIMVEYVNADIKTVINSMEIVEDKNGKLVVDIKLPGPNAKITGRQNIILFAKYCLGLAYEMKEMQKKKAGK
jgi:hypothetical protein